MNFNEYIYNLHEQKQMIEKHIVSLVITIDEYRLNDFGNIDDFRVDFSVSDVKESSKKFRYDIETEKFLYPFEEPGFFLTYKTMEQTFNHLRVNTSHFTRLASFVTDTQHLKGEKAFDQAQERLKKYEKDIIQYDVEYTYEGHYHVTPRTRSAESYLTVTGILSDLYSVKKTLHSNEEEDISNW